MTGVYKMPLISTASEAGKSRRILARFGLKTDLHLVAYVAYRCSNVVLSVQAALSVESDISSHLKRLLEHNVPTYFSSHPPEVSENDA